MRAFLSIAIALALAGCRPDPNMPMYEQTQNAQRVPIQDNGRVSVTRIGVFSDDLAYSGRRGVYLIKDEHTGREFIGVSGVGISETGSHLAGKNLHRMDER